MRDAIVIGGGLNGLVAGAALARRGLATTIVDQRPEVGGAAVTSEIAPGFRAPVLSHALGPIDPHVMRALRLDHAGLEFVTPDPALTSLGPDGRSLVFHRDPVLTAASIHQLSAGDASRWRGFLHTTQRIAGLIAELDHQTLPSIDDMRTRDWWPLIKLGRRVRKLGRQDLARLTRWMPMAVADLAAEWFESDLLQAALCARAVFGNFAGPWSAGTGAMLLQWFAADAVPVGGGVTVKGGPGAVTQALAAIATKAGAQIVTGARVTRIGVRDGRASGVELDNGQALEARAIVAAIDPRRAILDLVDPVELPVRFRERMKHIRARGVTAKINLALSGAPVVPGAGGRCRATARALPRGAERGLHRARVRRREVRRDLGRALARSRGAERPRSVARAGRPARDVDLRAVCAAATARHGLERRHARRCIARCCARSSRTCAGSSRRSSRARSSRRRIWSATGVRQADTSFTASRRSISPGSRGRSSGGRSTARPSRACTWPAQARIRAAASRDCPAGSRRKPSSASSPVVVAD